MFSDENNSNIALYVAILPSQNSMFKYVFSPFRHVVVVVDMEVLKSAEEAGGKIGNPTSYSTEGIALLMVCG